MHFLTKNLRLRLNMRFYNSADLQENRLLSKFCLMSIQAFDFLMYVLISVFQYISASFETENIFQKPARYQQKNLNILNEITKNFAKPI